MNTVVQETQLLRVVEKLAGLFGRGVVTSREVVDQLTVELAYYRRTDLAGAVLQRLPAEVVQDLRLWATEALLVDYCYRPRIIGKWRSEEFRQAHIRDMQLELVSLAARLQGLLSNSDSSSPDEASPA